MVLVVFLKGTHLENVNLSKVSSESDCYSNFSSKKILYFLKSDNTVIRDQLQNYERKDQRISKVTNFFHRCKNIKLRKYLPNKYSLSG